MLNADIYIADINLTIDNIKAAKQRGDTEAADRLATQHLTHLLMYCADHGLLLVHAPVQGFTLTRSGCEPAAVNILIGGKDGRRYRKHPNRRMHRHLDDCTDAEESLENAMMYWADRRAAERDYILLLP